MRLESGFLPHRCTWTLSAFGVRIPFDLVPYLCVTEQNGGGDSRIGGRVIVRA